MHRVYQKLFFHDSDKSDKKESSQGDQCQSREPGNGTIKNDEESGKKGEVKKPWYIKMIERQFFIPR